MSYRIDENKINERKDEISEKNKNTNKEKFIFFNFLMYNTKVEIFLDELQSYLFWIAGLEYFLWIIILALLITSFRTMGPGVIIFVYHVCRGTLGLFIVKHIPKTHEVIENLHDYENMPLEEIQKNMDENYINLIKSKEKFLRPMLICYFIITIISLILDCIMLIVVCSKFNDEHYSHRIFILIIIIVAFIGKIFLLIILVGDTFYFSILASMRFAFPATALRAVKRAGLGLFGDLKTGIKYGFGVVKNKLKKQAVNTVVANAL